MRNQLSILGKKVILEPIDSSAMRGVSVGDKLTYAFSVVSYLGKSMLFLTPKANNPTPRVCDITARRISGKMGMPVVFVLKSGPAYERMRLLDKGVYFVMSEKFAHLPMLVALERSSNTPPRSMLTPVAQYMLLHHLQRGNLAGLTAGQMQQLLPYSYASITLGMTCLEQLGLARKRLMVNRSKVLEFDLKGSMLWDRAQQYLSSPVERTLYCDDISTAPTLPVAGVNALAHYSMLTAASEQMVTVTTKQFKELESQQHFKGLNPLEGDVVIEVWKYPPLTTATAPQCVDPLSLALALKDDDDPRVQGEVENMINNMTWKD